MTYRHVPARWKLVAQLATLAVSAGVGVYVLTVAQQSDPRLSQIEQVMSARPWGIALILFGGVGLIAECFNAVDKRERLFWLVSTCHVMLFGIMVAFSASSFVGVITHNSQLWASVMLSAYVGLMNFVYVQRRGIQPANGHR